MKPLPVFQPSPAQTGTSDAVETAGMVRDPDRATALEPLVIGALSNVFDPEIPVNIYELGLIYAIIVDASSTVGIRMTLTAPACPAAQILPVEVRKRVAEIPGVSGVKVDGGDGPVQEGDIVQAVQRSGRGACHEQRGGRSPEGRGLRAFVVGEHVDG
jgi:metal-sulfur cluster biosynthetic enzyme